MIYSRYHITIVFALLLVAIVSIAAVHSEGALIDRCSPQALSLDRQSFCEDGTCLVVSGFHSRQYFLHQDRLPPGTLEEQILKYHGTAAAQAGVERGIHLYYDTDDLGLEPCLHCSVAEALERVFAQLGLPAQAATYDLNEAVPVAILEQEDIPTFMAGMAAR